MQSVVILASLFLAQLANVLDFLIILPLGTVFMREFQISPFEFSSLVSSYSIACAISGVISFRFVDRYDRKTLFLSAAAIFFASNIWCALSVSYPAFLTARIFAGLASGLLDASIFSVIADVFPMERRGRAVGIVTTAFAVASFGGVPAGIVFESLYGWRTIFYLIGTIALICVVVSIFCLPSLSDHIDHEGDPHDAMKKQLLKRIVADPHLRGGLILTAVVMFGVFLIVPFIASALVMNGGISQPDLSIVYMVGGVAALIATPLAGRMTDTRGRWVVYRVLAPLGAIAAAAITLLHDVTIFQGCIAIVFSMGLNSGRNVVANTIVSDLPEAQIRASYMSLKGAVQNGSAGLATFVAGHFVVEASGKLHGLWSMSILSFLFTVCSLPLAKRLTQDSRSDSEAILGK